MIHFSKRRLARALCALGPIVIVAACSPDATAPARGVEIAAPGTVAPSFTLSSGAEPMYSPGVAPLIWQDTFDSVSTDAAMLSKYATSNASFMHLDATGGLSGSHAARIDWKASTSCADDSRVLEKDFQQPTAEIYIQYSVRYTAGAAFDWTGRTPCTGNAKNLVLLWPGSGALFSFTSENHTLGVGSSNDHPLFAQNANASVSDEMLADGNWHRITLHVKQSSTPTSTDGTIEGWVDGVQRWSKQNIASGASGGWSLMKMPGGFNSGSPLNQSEWLDGLTVWGPYTAPAITAPAIAAPGAEPLYAAISGNLIWQDTFDSVTTDAAMLAKYATSNASFMHLDATGGLAGSHAARIDWKASTSCADDSRVLEKDFAKATNEIYVQYSVRYTAGAAFDWNGRTTCTGNSKNLMLLWPGSGALFSFTSENHVLGTGSTNDHPLFAQNAGTTVTDEMLADGNWHRVTMHVKQSSTPTATDGVIEGWIDGVLRWSKQNVASNASGGWTLMKMPASFSSGSPLNQSEWLDGLTVWSPSAVTSSPVVTPVSPVTPPNSNPVPTPPVTPVPSPAIPSAPPTASGSEPAYASGVNTLLWQDNFDAKGTDAAMLSPYATMNNESGIHFDAAAGLNGSGAARIDWIAQNSSNCLDNSHLIEKSFTPSQEVYVQYSVRYQPGFQFDWNNNRSSPYGCTGNAKKIMFLWAASGSRFDFISENHWLGMGSDNDHPLFNQNVGPVVSDEMLGDGNWHRFTIHVRQSSTPTTPDGLIEGWIDGVQRWSWPNVASNASGGWVLMKVPTTFNSGSPVNQSEWMDGLTIWKP